MRCVIFDLDGTLADTSGDLIDAANACFRVLGHGDLLDYQLDKATALRGGRAMLSLGFDRLGLAKEDAAKLVAENYQPLLEHYGTSIAQHTRFYPGALDAIASLRSDGYRVGICTNKPTDLAEMLIEELGVRNQFDSLVGATTLPVRKPDPAPYYLAVEQAGGVVETSLLVGDTSTDHHTARAANVASVLVTFGPSTEDVVAMAPEALLSDYADLPALVSALIG